MLSKYMYKEKKTKMVCLVVDYIIVQHYFVSPVEIAFYIDRTGLATGSATVNREFKNPV